MTDPLTKAFGGDLVSAGNEPAHQPGQPLAPQESQATPEDEAAAADPLGRTNDGPTVVNREVPPSGDHHGRDSETQG